MTKQPLLKRCAPYLPVNDVAAAVAFYRDRMGFSIEYVAGSPAEFAIVSRDAHPIMFRRVGGAFLPNEAQGGTWDIFFWTTDVQRIFSELERAGVEVSYPIRLTEYQTREFAVRDLNGYVIGFGQDV